MAMLIHISVSLDKNIYIKKMNNAPKLINFSIKHVW